MKNIHILPTDKPSRLSILNSGKLNFGAEIMSSSNSKPQHIYITNDEEIKEGEYGIDIRDSKVFKCERTLSNHYEFGVLQFQKSYCKKIILTTDQDLIKDGVQAIDDEFLEWFVKNPSCEFVELDVDLSKHNGQFQTKYGWKIIIPQEELERGITITHVGKQATLEEAAEIFVNNRFAKQISGDKTYPDIYASKEAIIESHILFAKWQAERMYSEEEVEAIWKFALYSAEQHDKFGTKNKSNFITKDVKEFIEQFKKK